jgi:hypothetical protein
MSKLDEARKAFHDAKDLLYKDFKEHTGISLPFSADSTELTTELTTEKINLIWHELTRKYQYYELLDEYNKQLDASDTVLYRPKIQIGPILL